MADLTVQIIYDLIENGDDVHLTTPEDYNNMIEYLKLYEAHYKTDEDGNPITRNFILDNTIDFEGEEINYFPQTKNIRYCKISGNGIKNGVTLMSETSVYLFAATATGVSIEDFIIEDCIFTAKGDFCLFSGGASSGNILSLKDVWFKNNSVDCSGNYKFLNGMIDAKSISSNSIIKMNGATKSFYYLSGSGQKVTRFACLDDLYFNDTGVSLYLSNGAELTYAFFRGRIFSPYRIDKFYGLTGSKVVNQVYIAIDFSNIQQLPGIGSSAVMFDKSRPSCYYVGDFLAGWVADHPENDLAPYQLKDADYMRKLGWNI